MALETLVITQAEAWESNRMKTVDSYESTDYGLWFKKELEAYGIQDIFTDAKIQKDAGKYIITAVSNPDKKFAIESKYLVPWIQQFYIDQQTAEQAQTQDALYIRLENIEWELVLEGIQWELNSLKQQIEGNTDRIERFSDVENIKNHLSRNIVRLEQQQKEAKNYQITWWYNRADKALWKMFEDQIEVRLDRLYNIKKQIEKMEQNNNKKYTIVWENVNGEKEIKDVQMDDIKGYSLEQTLLQFYEEIEKIEIEQPNFLATKNDIITGNGDATPYYEIQIHTVNDADKLKRTLLRLNNDDILLSKMTLSADKRKALQEDLNRLQEYLEEYQRNPNTFDLPPFEPESGEAFEEFCKLDPDMKKFMKLNKRAGKKSKWYSKPWYDEETTVNRNRNNQWDNQWNNPDVYANAQTNSNRKYQEKPKETYSSVGEAFEKWGVSGMVDFGLDQTHMTPEQKQFRWGVGNIAVLGGIGFLGYKMISSAFRMIFKSKKWVDGKWGTGIYDSKNRARLGIPTALIMGSQMYSGEWPLKLLTWGKLTEKLSGIWGWGNEWTTQEQETRLRYLDGFNWASAIFGTLTYGEMSEYLIEDNGHLKIDPNKHDTFINIFKNGPKKNDAAVKFLETIGKNDDKRVIDLALTGMGITSLDQLNDNEDKKFDQAASEAIVRLASVVGYMSEKWYNKINPETQHLVDEYIAKGKDIDDLEELDARGDIFYKEVITTDKTGLQDKITELAQGNKQKEQDLLLGINTFYDYFPTADKKIELIGTGPTIEFKTYNQTTKINIDNKSLVGFTPKAFDSYTELFKAANLTNSIKDICKDKKTNSDTPFHISSPGWDIEFSASSMIKADTEILSAGYGDALKKISPILETYKQKYCDYLNTTTPKIGIKV